MNCREFEALLCDYVDDQLDSETRRELDGHRIDCSACEEAVTDAEFGLALLRSDEGDESAGTPGFMAPEQLSARFGPVSERSDVYALGAVLHALLTGWPPHRAGSVLEMVMATIERPRGANLAARMKSTDPPVPVSWRPPAYSALT